MVISNDFTNILLGSLIANLAWLGLQFRSSVRAFDWILADVKTIGIALGWLVVSVMIGAVIWTMALATGGIIGIVGFSIGGAVAGPSNYGTHGSDARIITATGIGICRTVIY